MTKDDIRASSYVFFIMQILVVEIILESENVMKVFFILQLMFKEHYASVIY